MFVDARELDVRLGGARHDQAINDALRYRLGHRVPQQALHYHRPHVCEQWAITRAREVRQRRRLQRSWGGRRNAHHVARPAVHRSFKLRRRILLVV